MPVTLSEIIQDDAQRDGRRYVRNRHTFSEGLVRSLPPRLVPASWDELAALPVEAAQLEVSEKADELARLEGEIINGADYIATRDSALFSTLDEVESYFAKRVSNRLREITNEIIARDVPAIVAFKSPLFDSNAPRLGFLLTLSNADANAIKSEVQALGIAVEGYAHSTPIYEDVPGL